MRDIWSRSHWSDNWLELRVEDLISRRCRRINKRHAHDVISAFFELILYVRSKRRQRFDERFDLERYRSRWWSKRTVDCWLLQNLICSFECKWSKTRAFDVSWLAIRAIYSSSLISFVSKRRIYYSYWTTRSMIEKTCS